MRSRDPVRPRPPRRHASAHLCSRNRPLPLSSSLFRRWLVALLASPPLALLSLHLDLQARDPRSTSALAVYSLAAFSGFFWLQALQHAVGRLSFLPAGAFAETLLLPEPTTYALRRLRDALWPFTISFASVAPVVMAHESDRLLLLAVGACFLAAHSALGSLIAAERSRLKAAKADRQHLETEGKKTVKAANELQDKLAEAEAAKSRADKESAAATVAKVKAEHTLGEAKRQFMDEGVDDYRKKLVGLWGAPAVASLLMDSGAGMDARTCLRLGFTSAELSNDPPGFDGNDIRRALADSMPLRDLDDNCLHLLSAVHRRLQLQRASDFGGLVEAANLAREKYDAKEKERYDCDAYLKLKDDLESKSAALVSAKAEALKYKKTATVLDEDIDSAASAVSKADAQLKIANDKLSKKEGKQQLADKLKLAKDADKGAKANADAATKLKDALEAFQLAYDKVMHEREIYAKPGVDQAAAKPRLDAAEEKFEDAKKACTKAAPGFHADEHHESGTFAKAVAAEIEKAAAVADKAEAEAAAARKAKAAAEKAIAEDKDAEELKHSPEVEELQQAKKARAEAQTALDEAINGKKSSDAARLAKSKAEAAFNAAKAAFPPDLVKPAVLDRFAADEMLASAKEELERAIREKDDADDRLNRADSGDDLVRRRSAMLSAEGECDKTAAAEDRANEAQLARERYAELYWQLLGPSPPPGPQLPPPAGLPLPLQWDDTAWDAAYAAVAALHPAGEPPTAAEIASLPPPTERAQVDSLQWRANDVCQRESARIDALPEPALRAELDDLRQPQALGMPVAEMRRKRKELALQLTASDAELKRIGALSPAALRHELLELHGMRAAAADPAPDNLLRARLALASRLVNLDRENERQRARAAWLYHEKSKQAGAAAVDADQRQAALRATHAKAAHTAHRVANLQSVYNMGNVSASDCRSSDGVDYTAEELFAAGCRRGFKAAKFTVRTCQAVPGFDLSCLREAGFSANDVRQAGKPAAAGGGPYSFSDLWRADFRVGFKAAGFSVTECAHPAQVAGGPLIRPSLEELRKAGFSAADVLEMHPSPPAGDLYRAGFAVSALKEAHFSASDLHASGVPARVALDAGFLVAELLAAGQPSPYTERELKAGGVGPQELSDAIDPHHKGHLGLPKLKALGFGAAELLEAGADLDALRRTAGFTARELRDAGASLADLLRVAHFSDAEVCRAGSGYGDSIKDLWEAGARKGYAGVFKAADFAAETGVSRGETGVSMGREFRAAGYSAADAVAAADVGFTTKDLKEAGYELSEVLLTGVSLWEAREAGGFSYPDFRSGAHAANPLFKRLRCKEAGFSAKDVADGEGPGAWAECRAGGSDPCGFEPRDFLKNGVSVKECCELGMSIAELVGAGVVPDFKLLKEAGFTMQECRAANVENLSLADCRRLGWTLREFLAAGVSGSECRSGGHFTAADFKESGFSFADCVAFGFSAVELAGQGFEMAGAARAL